jgi:hypothetical protein
MDDVGTRGACAREMPVLHDLMRTEFTALRGLVGGVDPRDASRVPAVARHIGFMLDLLAERPAPVKILWPLVGRRRHRRYISPVRGTS